MESILTFELLACGMLSCYFQFLGGLNFNQGRSL